MNELVFGNLELFVRSVLCGLLAASVVTGLCLTFRRAKLSVASFWIFGGVPFLLVLVAVVVRAANIPYSDDYNSIVAYAARLWPERLRHLADYNWEHRVFLTNFTTELMLQLTGRLNFKVLMVVGLFLLAVVGRFLAARLASTGRQGRIFAVAVLLCLFSLFSDYTFWPMASIQNYGVLCLGLLSVLAMKSSRRWGLAASCALATAATFSSGGGMLVWPCLLLMAWLVPAWRRPWKDHVVLIALAAASVGLYFSTTGTPQEHAEVFSLWRAAVYFLTFVGGWCCLPGVAPVVGFGMCGVLAVCLLRVKSLKRPEVFFFAAYILATMMAGSVFRSDRIVNALPPWHSELSFSLLGCFLILALDEFRPREWMVSVLSYAILFFAVSVNAFSFVFWGRIWQDRLEIDRRNLLIRPISAETITSACSVLWLDRAVQDLDVLERRGVYSSHWTLVPGEVIPTERIDPGDYWTPGRRKAVPRQE